LELTITFCGATVRNKKETNMISKAEKFIFYIFSISKLLIEALKRYLKLYHLVEIKFGFFKN